MPIKANKAAKAAKKDKKDKTDKGDDPKAQHAKKVKVGAVEDKRAENEPKKRAKTTERTAKDDRKAKTVSVKTPRPKNKDAVVVVVGANAEAAKKPQTRMQTSKLEEEAKIEATAKTKSHRKEVCKIPAPLEDDKKATKATKAKPQAQVAKKTKGVLMKPPPSSPPCVRVANFFELGEKLGSGAFGDVFSARDIRTGAEVAIKMESIRAECPQLLYESRVMQELQSAPGFPRHYWFGREGDYHVLVMQRLGRCLASRYLPVELGVVQLVARDALARLQTLHAAGLAHRDIKPENFVYGLGATKAVLYIIDFGLCKRVAEPRTGRHIPHRLGKSLSGTPRYASTRMHDGEEQARRDDIEALGYMLVYLVKGVLPWQGLPAKNDYRDAGNMKKKIKVEVLCEGLPPAFAATITYARGLDFFAMPDYVFLRSLWAST